MTLLDEATTYFDAEGWSVNPNRSGSGFVSATRAGFGGGTDTVSIWCPSIEPDEWRSRETAVLNRFAEEGASGARFLLVETREGISTDFQRRARADHNVQVRTPIQFFDAPFKWDFQANDSKSAAPSAAAQLHVAGTRVAVTRTPQPFRDESTGEVGPDLLKELEARFIASTTWTQPVILVTAPAGFGKSTLFSSLYASLYDQFQAAKREQRRARRPLPLLPEYAAAASGPTLRGLMDSFMKSDIARPIGLPAFEWMLTHGYASWLLDGLDELISRDLGFFEYIEDILTKDTPVAPRILICVRDSLLSASQGLRDFIADSEGVVRQYRLLPWDRPSIQTFARIRLRNKDQKMLEALDREGVLNLCGTPYYAALLADRIEGGGTISSDWGEFQLIDDALESVVAREYEKDLLRANVVAPSDVLAIVEDVAVMELENGARGVAIDEILDLARIVLPTDLDEESRERAETQFTQLSVFQQSAERGRVRFAQDVIFEYLVGKRATQWFQSNPSRFVDLLSWRRLPPDSVALRVMRQYVNAFGAYNDLQIQQTNASANPDAFVNILQIILGLPRAGHLLADIPLERQDLSGVTFSGLALDGVSFKGANLESATFSNCDLRGANFSEAMLHMTRFAGCGESIREAEFGGLAGFVSVRVGSEKTVDTVDEFLALVRRKPGTDEQVVGPCPSAMQLRVLLLKFVRPDGKARRDWMGENAVLAGRRFVDPASVLRAAEHAGLVVKASGRQRYERARGELYADIVAFVRSLQMSASIRSVLQDVCDRRGCLHVAEM